MSLIEIHEAVNFTVILETVSFTRPGVNEPLSLSWLFSRVQINSLVLTNVG
jgi:hypothetical protein